MTREQAEQQAAAMIASGKYDKAAASPINPTAASTGWMIQYRTAGERPQDGEIR